MKNEVLKYTISAISSKTKSCKYIQLGSHGASSSRNISFRNLCILPIAEERNLFTIVTVTWSKGRRRPPNSNRIFYSQSKLLNKCDICVPSNGLQAITFWLRFDQRDSRLSLKSGQSNRKWLTSSTLSLQRRQSPQSVLVSQRTLPLIPKFPMSLICRV